jgi:hypothetical protein
MRKIESRGIHAAFNQLIQQGRGIAGGANGAHDFGFTHGQDCHFFPLFSWDV